MGGRKIRSMLVDSFHYELVYRAYAYISVPLNACAPRDRSGSKRCLLMMREVG